MTVDKILQFIIGYNGTIIWVLFALILILTIFVSFKMFFSKSGGESSLSDGAGANFHQIEESLKKILEKGTSLGGGEGAGASGAGGAGISTEELDRLKGELSAKEGELQKMRAEASAGGGNSEELSKLEDKVKELEVRLAEYEIIAEDIADLSRYKEENTRLKKELDQYRQGGQAPAPMAAAPAEEFKPAPAVPQAAAPAPTPAAPAAASQSDIDAIMAQTTAEPASPPVAAPAPAAAEESFIDDDIMAEFAKAVEAQKAGTLTQEVAKPAPAAAPTPAPVAAPPPPAPAPAVASSQSDIDAIMAQAAAEPTPTPAPAAAAAEASTEKADVADDGFAIDVDKMVAEAADLGNASDVADVDNVLDASLDEDKLLAEAGLMATGDDKEKDKEKETANLMGEFENFVGNKT